MTCEVNITPPNPNSMLFHKHMGFKKVGTIHQSFKSKGNYNRIIFEKLLNA